LHILDDIENVETNTKDVPKSDVMITDCGVASYGMFKKFELDVDMEQND